MRLKVLKSLLTSAVAFAFIMCMVVTLPILPTAQAVSQAYITEPMNGQIIPYYEVWLRWVDCPDEDHYIMSVRNLDTNTLIVSNEYVAQNSNHYVIPISKLTPGARYRWSLCAYNAAGDRTFSPEHIFKIESGINGVDSHLWKTSYTDASSVNYFIAANSTSTDSVIQNSIQAWNNISSKVHLYRDYSSNKKKLGIYESSKKPSDGLCGETMPGGADGYSSSFDPYAYGTVSYTEVVIYSENLKQGGAVDMIDLEKTVKHEIGHVLSLAHTNGKDEGATPNAPHGNRIDFTDPGKEKVYLIMNSGIGNTTTEITTTDRDHLRIKWGA